MQFSFNTEQKKALTAAFTAARTPIKPLLTEEEALEKAVKIYIDLVLAAKPASASQLL